MAGLATFYKKHDIFIWSIVFRILLEVIYIKDISRNYDQFVLDFNFNKYLISWVMLTLSLFLVERFISSKELRTSSLVCFIIYLMNYIPLISLWALADMGNIFFLYFNVYWFLILGLINVYSSISIKPRKPLSSAVFSRNMLYGIFAVFALFGLYFSYRYNGLRIHLDFLDVYSHRYAFQEKDISTLMNLAYYIVSSVVFPFYAIKFLLEKKWIFFTFACFMQLLMFSMAGNKSYLMIIPVGIVACYFYNDKYISLVPKLLSGLTAVAFLEIVINKSAYIASFFVRRLLYIPAIISSYYCEFFTENSPVYFAQDKVLVRFGLESPYSQPFSRVIGEVYYTNATNANTGMLGDAFANLGVYSIVFFPIIFIFALILLDRITYGISKKVYMGVLVAMIVAFLNGEISGIFYNFLAPLFVLLFFIPPKTSENSFITVSLENSETTCEVQ